MDVKKIAKYKDKLLKEKTLLEGELGNLGKETKKGKDWEPTPPMINAAARADKNELADRFGDFEEIRAAQAQLEIRLNHVNKALKSIEEGTYGLCEVDNKPIGEARLEANPAATTCIEHTP